MKFPWSSNSIVDVLKKENENKIEEKLNHVSKGKKNER